MRVKIDLETLVHEIGPGFAETVAERDETDTFIGPNYDVLKARRILSAQVPAELGGGGASHREI